jgi:hypothetical protein
MAERRVRDFMSKKLPGFEARVKVYFKKTAVADDEPIHRDRIPHH